MEEQKYFDPWILHTVKPIGAGFEPEYQSLILGPNGTFGESHYRLLVSEGVEYVIWFGGAVIFLSLFIDEVEQWTSKHSGTEDAKEYAYRDIGLNPLPMLKAEYTPIETGRWDI